MLSRPEEHPEGAEIRSVLQRSLTNSATLIVVASDGAFQSDWVAWELDQFQSRENRKIIGIDFDGSPSEASTDGTPFETFKEKLCITETGESLRESAPSQAAVEAMTKSFTTMRAHSRRKMALLSVAGVSATIGFIAGVVVGKLL